MIFAGQDLAKAIQRLIATGADPVQRYGLAALKGKMHSTAAECAIA